MFCASFLIAKNICDLFLFLISEWFSYNFYICFSFSFFGLSILLLVYVAM